MPPRVSSMPQPCPAVSPDHTNETERRWFGAVRKCPTCGSLDDRRRSQILKADAIEDVLTGRKILEQHLGGEIALRQRVDRDRVADVAKLSLVATSTSMRAGRSVRAQTTPESIETSPDCMPCVMRGRSPRG